MSSNSGAERGAPPFAGNERFRIDRQLGAGGFGVVYEAFDRKTRSPVALKVLSQAEPSWVYRFKLEFRSLRDVSHPNLAALYELLSEGETWFFTMELIQGTSFLRYVHGGPEGLDETVTQVTHTVADPTALQLPVTPVSQTTMPELDLPKLREAFRQLTLGIEAIHRAGMMHRDIKPSNILVEASGRVVILDFGLVADSDSSMRREVAGTPKYMAPEQRTGGAGPASDWFSMGVILYECLTGRNPFVSRESEASEIPAPWHWNPGAPRKLSRLCMALLDPDPARRPSPEQILAEFGDAEGLPRQTQGIFVGRKWELSQLESAFETSLSRHAVSVLVEGESGIGKTSLIRHFLGQIGARHPDAVILSSRCYDRESVAYNALDGIADQLSQLLQELPAQDATRLLPSNTLALTRLFPVLGRVRAVEAGRTGMRETADPQELRRQGMVAMRELLARISARYPLVLHIEDMQWGDRESAPLIEAILTEPDAPQILLIASHRGEESLKNPTLQLLMEAAKAGGDSRQIRLGRLSDAEARELIDQVAGAPGLNADKLIREARGNPFLIGAMARRGDEAFSGTGSAMEAFMARESARLPAQARALLEILSVAARPVTLEVLAEIEGLDSGPGTLNLLRAERLCRSRYNEGHEEIETYHDRIREGLTAVLAPARRAECHLALAGALAAAGTDRLDDAAMHYLAGGQVEMASKLAEQAAPIAFEALAFERAARLYQVALRVQPDGDAARLCRLRCGLAESLMNAGRSVEAAKEWEQAAAVASPALRTECIRSAAELYILSGHLEIGRALLRSVLEARGLRMPRSARLARIRFKLRRVLLRLRGLRFRERNAADTDPASLARIDACATAVLAFVVFDSISGFDFQSRHVLEALAAGDKWRLARALSYDIAIFSQAGMLQAAGLQQERAVADKLVAELNDPFLSHVHACGTSFAEFGNGHWLTAIERLETVEMARIASTRQWPIGNSFVILLQIYSLMFAGELGALRTRLPLEIRKARERGDLFLEVVMHTPALPLLRLGAGDPATARAELRAVMARWPQVGFFVPNFWAVNAECEIYLFEGDAEAAWREMESHWSIYLASELPMMEHIRIWALFSRARIAVQTGRLRVARECARKLEKEMALWAAPVAVLTRACLANAEGRSADAPPLLREAEMGLGRMGMKLLQASVRVGLWKLAGDVVARNQATEYFRLNGVAEAEKIAAIMAPLGQLPQ